ncbi:uncharacterized protein LOC122063414 [Macadamia integrifolia]|uniref:uncharacterized protein LOC122063414 n=1 Tax=Macadamia integrifolia TaxID=60698 RepID=UPI001C4EE77A|nr:uncharacterized protein LOC122063414 [Macadamia integrifolia]
MELDKNESLQLFSLNAFSKDQPPDDYMHLSVDIVDTTGGLPLALDVLGSDLSFTKDKEVWKSMHRLLKQNPHDTVYGKLKISYDSLQNAIERVMFLDAACFFIGWEEENVISIWEACGFVEPRCRMEVLKRKSLLKIKQANVLHMHDQCEGGVGRAKELGMHDQIHDLGRAIVNNESPTELGKQSRLWSCDIIIKGNEMVEGIQLSFSSTENICLDTNAFEQMPKLRLLQVDGATLKGSFQCLPSRLSWLGWRRCPLDEIPAEFYHDELIMLDLSQGQFKRAWNSWLENKLFQQLKVLKLSWCLSLSESPDFSGFPRLEKLYLVNCNSLVNLHELIGQLQELVYLKLERCSSLKELPNSICRLSSLQTLILNYCESLNKVPEDIGELKESLIELFLKRTNIEALPNGIEQLRKLEVLDLAFCQKLVNVPSSMENMTSLRHIDLSLCSKLECTPKFPSHTQIHYDTFKLNMQRLPEVKWAVSFPESLDAGSMGRGLVGIFISGLLVAVSPIESHDPTTHGYSSRGFEGVELELNVGSSSYDVFINFRGEDTRSNLVGHLYMALKDRGIHAFIDSKDLWKGDDIEPALLRAIKGSKLSIAIFSERYAESRWCLRELVQMLKCHRTNGQIIFPIFFKVKTSDVKNQTGCFQISPQKHGKEAPQTLQRWKDTLRAVGNKSGWVFDNGDKSELVKLVVQRAWIRLNMVPLIGVKHPVGLESRIDYVLSLLSKTSSSDVQFLVISGLGGIGKTTIATAIYNCIFENFSKSCFLEDIREQASQPNGIVCLQEKLLYNIFREQIKICSSREGSRLIKERLGKIDILLILDDVGNRNQLNALAGDLNWFGYGSKIILTTRDQSILVGVPENNICKYEPRELNEEESLQLFSSYAFSTNQPPDDYMQLSVDIVRTTGGLPLALEVLGSDLSFAEDKEVWKSMHRILEKVPHDNVYEKLKTSYDNLHDFEKAMFLDATCFFIGWEEETILSIWEACGFEPKYRIEVLKRKSLLKITKSKELWMHDQIRDMGRGIIYNQNPMEPDKCSRLWSFDIVMKVLNGGKGNEIVEGLFLGSNSNGNTYLHIKSFEQMPRLRLLEIDGASLEGSFSCLPYGLRWLRWRKCPLENLSANFYHEELVILDLTYGLFRQAWNNWPENKVFQQLKTLKLSCCLSLTESPNFLGFPCLERLYLDNCAYLAYVHESIGQLQQLVYLNLRCCYSLKKLPNSICKLSSLQRLILTLCISLTELPGSIGDLKESLIELSLDKTNIKVLPDGVGLLKKMKVLDLSLCYGLVVLPESLEAMTSLCYIDLSGRDKLRRVPKLPSNLVELRILCKSLVNLPVMKNMKKLELLCLKDFSVEGKEACIEEFWVEAKEAWVKAKEARIEDLLVKMAELERPYMIERTKYEFETCLVVTNLRTRLELLNKSIISASLYLSATVIFMASSSREGSTSYDLFINFRGEDTRNTFVGHLYSALKDRGIHSFMDSKYLWKGEDIGPELLRVIKVSDLSIAVFSERYTESKWCLEELSQMLECHRTNHQFIFPIFFNVKTSDVKNQTGCFEISPQRHGKEAPDTLLRWKDALREVGDKSGWVFESPRWIGIPCRICVISTIKYQFYCCSIYRDMWSRWHWEDDHCIAVYNRMFRKFSKSCFLENVGESASQINGMISLQKLLLEKVVFREEIKISSSREGSSLIKRSLGKTDTLLILDDVSNHTQLKALAGDLNWFGPKSKIIITTRDHSLLMGVPRDNRNIYEPQELNEEESLRLFSKYAFSAEQPPNDYMQLSIDIVSTTGGLPLALEVLGSDLSIKKDKGVWKSMHWLLEQIPHDNVYGKLKISYDNLQNDIEKAMFLDVACFFGGREVENVIYMWEACGIEEPRCRIEVLERRSLLKINESKELWMHDQIRGMGRAIVNNQSPMEPGKRSRLWSRDIIMKVLKGHKENEMVEGIMLSFNSEENTCLHTNSFEKMTKLRLLQVDGATLKGSFQCLPSGLSWLGWQRCSLDEIPTEFYHEALGILDLSHGQFKLAWNSWPENQLFQQLKVLKLSWCSSLSKSPDFSGFPRLEKLYLDNCNSLINLHESIGQLQELVYLNLERCSSIKKLPNSICRLRSLQKLILSHCMSLNKFPESIGDLKESLIELSMKNTNIEALRHGIALLKKLKVLDISCCCKACESCQGRRRIYEQVTLYGPPVLTDEGDSMILSTAGSYIVHGKNTT